jgi:flagellar basal-body rod protein FlgB
MDFNKIPLFSAMTQRMAWLGQRQQVLAQNIANSDTANYVAQDLKPPSFDDVLRGSRSGLTVATTQPRHIGGIGQGTPVVERSPDSERKGSGNAVVLEDQMMKVSQTALDFQLTTNLYRKHLAMIKTALGRGAV